MAERTLLIPAARPRPANRARRSSRAWWAWARVLGGMAILALLVWRVGTGPFLVGVRAVDASALLIATGIGVVVTVCCAWRWRLVAAGLGVDLPLSGAVAAYYRSQFLNTTLPGGVVGDVHRAVRHGSDIGDVGLGIRAVVLERVAGQCVQIAIAAVLLLAVPSPVQSLLPAVVVIMLVAGGLLWLVARGLIRRASTRWRRGIRRIGVDIRDALFTGPAGLWVALASVIVVGGHLATFLLAARTAGATAPLSRLLPLGLLILLAMALPLNIAGWGPREGAAAWAFAAAGLTATLGISVAVTYGVLVFVACSPGAVVLAARWLRGGSRAERLGGSRG
jgi:uncharacterized membrane protein YbhN (UPF0104 family)